MEATPPLISSKENGIQIVIFLAWFTIAYNVIEGLVSMYFGSSESSISLFGFGADSFIEVFSAFIVLWRFKEEYRHTSGISLQREKIATSMIGFLLILLSMGTAVFSALQLVQKSHPETTWPGAVISALSLSFMFFLWHQKRKWGRILESQTVLSDASCSLACIKLSVILFLGSILYAFWPQLWWADSAAALAISFFIYKEGQGLRKSAKSGGIPSCCCH